jgi:hypothetical protein
VLPSNKKVKVTFLLYYIVIILFYFITGCIIAYSTYFIN